MFSADAIDPVIGFTQGGRQFTPDDPCTFKTPIDNRCLPSDAFAWQKHTEQWLAALSKRATTPERAAIVENLFRRYAKLSEYAANCSALPWGANCTAPTEGFIATAKLAQAYLEAWGEAVASGEIVRDHGRNALALPVPPEVRDMALSFPWLQTWWDKLRGAVEEHVKDNAFQAYLPIAAALLAAMAASDRRRK